LIGVFVALVLGAAAAYVALGAGRPEGLRPGDPIGHLLGAAGALLMSVGLLFPLVKRTSPLAYLKPWWHQLHLLLGATGAAMAAVHTCGRMGKAPTLVALAMLGLLALGAYGRLLAGRLAHTTFASDPSAFLPVGPPIDGRLLSLAKRRAAIAAGLKPDLEEGSFSLALGHWSRHPVASARFARLALEEELVVGSVRKLPSGFIVLIQRNWRLLHLILVALMGLGLLAHVVAVLFFAGYVAEGGQIYWWHLRE